jgi:Protein of unknown function (DUF3253)
VGIGTAVQGRPGLVNGRAARMPRGGAAIGAAGIESKILECLAERAPDASICPSDVACALAPGDEARWRALMPRVRDVAAGMLGDGRIRVTRGADSLAAGEFDGGPIRIRRGPAFPRRLSGV